MCALQKHVDHYYWPRFMPNNTLLKREHWCALAYLVPGLRAQSHLQRSACQSYSLSWCMQGRQGIGALSCSEITVRDYSYTK